MKRSKMNALLAILLAGMVTLSACAAPAAQPTTPTVDAQVVAKTVAAIQTQAVQNAMATLTAEAVKNPTATNTPVPTQTTAPTATATVTVPPVPTKAPTIVYPTAAPTLAPTAAPYQCTLVSSSPKAGTEFAGNADLDVTWTVTNSGTKTWLADDVDLGYVKGDKFQKKDLYDLKASVKPGEKVTLIVDARAPTASGTYSFTFALRNASVNFCLLTAEIKTK